MGKVNVDRNQNAAAAQVPSTTGPSALEKPTQLLGDYVPDLKDIILPRINIVHDISDLHKEGGFPSGSILFNQSTILFAHDRKQGDKVIEKGTPPLIVIVLGFKPITYIEDVKGGGMGMFANSTNEVVAKGGTLDYEEAKQNPGKKLFVPQATALLAIKRPEHLENDGTIFTYDVGADQYALALWAFKKSAYTEACKKTLFYARNAGCLKAGGYPSFTWKVQTYLKPFKQSNTSAWVPQFLPNARSTAEQLAFASNVLNIPSATPADDSAAE